MSRPALFTPRTVDQLVAPEVDPRHILGRMQHRFREHALLAAMLEGAVDSVLGRAIRGRKGQQRREREGDRAWLASRAEVDVWGTAAFICRELGIDQGWLLAGVARLARQRGRGRRTLRSLGASARAKRDARHQRQRRRARAAA